MNNDFDTQKRVNAPDEEGLESFDEYEVGSLSPNERKHYPLINLKHAKQRLLDVLENVSRATLQDISQNDEEEQIDEDADRANGETDEIEISALPPTRRSHYLLLKLARLRAALAGLGLLRARKSAPLTPTLRQRSPGRALTALGICIALLVLLLGNIPSLRATFLGLLGPTPTPTPGASFTFSSMPIVVNHFGPIPAYSSQSSPGPLPPTCPQISTLQYFTTPLDPPGLGASPIWLAGFTGPSAALDNLVPINAQVAHAPWPGGWYETVAVFIQKNYTGDIILRGGSQKDGAPVWLSKNNPQILGNTLALNLEDGSHFIANGQWEMTSITIAVPTAGCYTLQASWSGNSWTRFFAAGR
ncbi:MAG TPA: hypothetical protein VGM01_14505 [Ktedonobacteraceae bacterium]|jgi:hypothetical protein